VKNFKYDPFFLTLVACVNDRKSFCGNFKSFPSPAEEKLVKKQASFANDSYSAQKQCFVSLGEIDTDDEQN
jgi:hypothetical protein